MPKDVNAGKFEVQSNQTNTAAGASDWMFQQVHDLGYACPDGSLVKKPTDCGDLTAFPTNDIDDLFGKLEII